MIFSRSKPGNAHPTPATTSVAGPAEEVRVSVPARLHLGFLDMNGGLGRRFGSLGITLDGPSTRVVLRHGEGLSATGHDAARARALLERIVAALGLAPGHHLRVERAIPPHVGLGSGTQMALAVGAAVCRLHGLEHGAREIATILGRGVRSGLGVASFEAGGVMLDGGRGDADAPPPVLSRLPFPEEWRILLISDRARRGVHGERERTAIARLPAFPAERAAHLCRLALMVALPALAEGDLARFGGAVAELQREVGDHFAPAQGGRFASPAVARALAWLESEGVAGVGQSSWGPTGFALLGSHEEAGRLLAAARRRWPEGGDLGLAVCRGRNSGCETEAVATAICALEDD